VVTGFRVYHDNGDGEREDEEGHNEHERVEEHLPRFRDTLRVEFCYVSLDKALSAHTAHLRQKAIYIKRQGFGFMVYGLGLGV